jgi:hypothetical protein
MLRTSLISGLILDGILLAYTFVSGVVSVMRNWEASQAKATGHTAVVARRVELLISGVLYGLAGALATHLALKWTKAGQ